MEKQAQVNLTRLPSLIKLSGVIEEAAKTKQNKTKKNNQPNKKKTENNFMFYFSL